MTKVIDGSGRLAVKMAAVVAAAIIGSAAHASTLNTVTAPMGLSYSGGFQTVNDSLCPNNGTCVKLNNNEAFTITAEPNYTFDVSSFDFGFNGNGKANTLSVSVDGGAPISLTEVVYPKHNNFTYDFSPDLSGIMSLSFTHSGGGTVVLGNIDATVNTVSSVPLPAAGVLLLGAVGGIGAFKRRRKAA